MGPSLTPIRIYKFQNGFMLTSAMYETITNVSMTVWYKERSVRNIYDAFNFLAIQLVCPRG